VIVACEHMNRRGLTRTARHQATGIRPETWRRSEYKSWHLHAWTGVTWRSYSRQAKKCFHRSRPVHLEQDQRRDGLVLPQQARARFCVQSRHGSHTNTFGLDSGRYRTNVWDYAGVNTLRSGRGEELAMHPTVKPVALVADAIRDCSRRGESYSTHSAGPAAR
jgi:hypothetical protein